MKPTAFVMLTLIGLARGASASDAIITNAVYAPSVAGSAAAPVTATFTVQWRNAWRNNRNHDAVWVFFKLRKENETRSQRHARLTASSPRLVSSYEDCSVDPTFWIPADRTGLMIAPISEYRGDVRWRIQVELELPGPADLPTAGLTFAEAHVVEMVFIPPGPYYLGDSDPVAQASAAAFYNGGTRRHFRVSSEAAVSIGLLQGQLAYDNAKQPVYRGDMLGPIPAEFPKGFDPFYVMKYELTEGAYVDFLNSIAAYWTSNRANFGGRFYAAKRGSIRLEAGVYRTASRNRPAGFLSFEDAAAWTDWAALRPMTELEFEKAARGPAEPVPNDYPWGTACSAQLSRYFDESGDLIWQAPLNERDLTDANRARFGASYYGAMDLNKGLWERVVTVGNPRTEHDSCARRVGPAGRSPIASVVSCRIS